MFTFSIHFYYLHERKAEKKNLSAASGFPTAMVLLLSPSSYGSSASCMLFEEPTKFSIPVCSNSRRSLLAYMYMVRPSVCKRKKNGVCGEKNLLENVYLPFGARPNCRMLEFEGNWKWQLDKVILSTFIHYQMQFQIVFK